MRIRLASPALSPTWLREIEPQISEHTSIEQVVRWGLSQAPAKLILDVVKQDEFTQDVVLAYRDDIHLVYDCT